MFYRLKAVFTLPAKRDGDSENVLSRKSFEIYPRDTLKKRKKIIIDKMENHHKIVYHPCTVVNNINNALSPAKSHDDLGQMLTFEEERSMINDRRESSTR